MFLSWALYLVVVIATLVPANGWAYPCGDPWGR